MKTKLLLLVGLAAGLVLTSCKKSANIPQITFTNNVAEGTASNNGEYTITGHITSEVRLDKVVLTKDGQNNAFLTDEATAKNKNEYDYAYLVTGINNNTYIMIDVYNQDGGKVTTKFLIKK